jgi:hypothetical protein
MVDSEAPPRYDPAMIIDVHTHAFPDQLAARAMAQLQAKPTRSSPCWMERWAIC